jgi:hypothetical protein
MQGDPCARAWSSSTPLSRVHLLIILVCPRKPQNGILVDHRSHPKLTPPPAASLLLVRKQSRSVFTFSRSPHCPEPRRNPAVDQEPPEVRRRSTRATSSDLAHRNPSSSWWAPLPFNPGRPNKIQWIW